MKYGHAVGIFSALLGAAAIIAAAFIQRGDQVTSLKQELGERGAELTALRQHVAELENRMKARNAAPAQMLAPAVATDTSSSTPSGVASAGRAPSSTERVVEPPASQEPISQLLSAAEFTLQCRDVALPMPQLHDIPEFPAGIVGVVVYLKPHDCWSDWLVAPQGYKTHKLKGSGKFDVAFDPFEYAWDWNERWNSVHDEYRMPQKPFEKIRFRNLTDKPIAVAVAFYGR